MLNIHNLSVSFSGDYLFEEISFRLNGGDRVGLIGKNGAGKSTLLKLLSGDMAPDSGTIAIDREIRVGYLRQDIDFVQGRTVLEEAYCAFGELKQLEKRLGTINEQLAERTDYESDSYTLLLQELSDLTHRFEILGGYNYEGETEKILRGLGFQREDFERQTDTFSGGWRMRLELAKLLLQQNDVLLLDEPTNHLDIESILWLEQFLGNFPGAVVLVSHDRVFLDTITNRTIEISLGRIYDYSQPYSRFLQLRQEIREQQLSAQRNQQKEIQQAERLIEKFRAKSTKASMAQSLIKKLDKMERIEVDEEDTSAMKVRFTVSVTPGKVVLEMDHLSKNFGKKEVLRDINLLLERDSKTAFVGQNGQGKTTLAKIIVGELTYEGKLKLGHNVQIGYFAQNQAETLEGDKTVLEVMTDAANETNRSRVRDILGAFLFSGEDVDKYVRVLSGGERNRLALAKLLLQPYNVLVMDEPTNHLDISSKKVLKQALQHFQGTLILVSHDRDFLQGLTNKVYEFRDKKIREYLGDINFYLEERRALDFREIERKDDLKAAETKQRPANQAQASQKKVKKLKNKLSSLERDIAQLETDISRSEETLAEKHDDASLYKSYREKQENLKNLMQEWETLSLKLES